MKRATRWWARLLQPRILIPVLLAAALLTFAFSITDLGRVMGDIRGIPLAAMAGTLGLAAAYLGIKWFELNVLLNGLGIYPSWRQLVVASAVGEMTLTIPSGIYVQNYVLKHVQGAGFARSSAATTATLAAEALVVFLTLAILPVPGWRWLQPIIIGMLAAAVLAGLGLYRWQHARNALTDWLSRNTAGRGIIEMLEGLRALCTFRLAAWAFLLSAAYLLLLVWAFLVIGHGAGVPGLNFLEALTTYFFSLGIILILGGFLSQLGVMEVAGLGVARAWGYSATQGLAMLLGFRIVWVVSIWLIGGTLLVILRNQFRNSPVDDAQESGD